MNLQISQRCIQSNNKSYVVMQALPYHMVLFMIPTDT